MRRYAVKATRWALWVARRLGAGMLFLCGGAVLVWIVLQASDTLLEAAVVVGLGASFMVGHALVSAFDGEDQAP